MARILAALSGGIDSSVAAALLVGQGHQVVGVSLQLVDESRGGEVSRCCSPRDLRDARLVAGHLGIPYYVLNEEEGFRRSVLDPFLESYRAGETPNPCVDCNSRLKFGSLLGLAGRLGLDAVATGHYARVEPDPEGDGKILLRGADRTKDQSYFLWDLAPRQLERTVLPLGGMTKQQVRSLASAMALPVAGKPESQDLCFVPEGDTRAYLADRLGPAPEGEMVDQDGRLLARHTGVHNFTIGQRRGLGLASSVPLYVVDLDAGSSRVVVGPASALYSREVTLAGARLREKPWSEAPFRASAQIRSRHEPAPCSVEPAGEGRLRVRFDEPQRAVTPGQALVLYRDDAVLGGGWIRKGSLDSREPAPLDYGHSRGSVRA